MCHLGKQNVQKIFPNSTGDIDCEPCKLSNSKRQTGLYGDLIVCDYEGPFSIADINGNKGYFSLVDKATGYGETHLVKLKSEFPVLFKDFANRCKIAGTPIKIFRTDGAKEFQSNVMKEFYSQMGIIHQVTLPKVPESNMTAESYNHVLMSKCRPTMCAMNIPARFWGPCIKYCSDMRVL